MNKQVLEIIKQRDNTLLEKYCLKGNFIGENGSNPMYVCRPVDANEILEFMHQWDAALLDVMNNV